jgi:predicted metal-binding membrane protein
MARSATSKRSVSTGSAPLRADAAKSPTGQKNSVRSRDGYLLVWTAFSLAATAAQWALQRAALLDPMMTSVSEVFGAMVLIGAGAYQWTSLKDICLKNCRSPLAFILQHGGFRRDARSSLLLGLRHGGYCVGCC